MRMGEQNMGKDGSTDIAEGDLTSEAGMSFDSDLGSGGMNDPFERPPGWGASIEPVRFVDDPKHPRGRGRLDMSTGNRF